MHRISLIKLFTSFAMLGAEWVMWILVGLSLISIAIMVERARYYRSLRDDLNWLADRLNHLLRDGDIAGAAEALRGSPSPAALVALAGVDELSRGAHAVERVMAAAQARVKAQLDRNLAFLGTVGNNAPFVGLFGTVVGIIQAFDALKPAPGHAAAQSAAAATAATGRVMGTLAEALVATAIGLLVAIPAVAAFNYFQRVVKSLMNSTEQLSETVLAHAHTEHEDNSIGALIKLLRGEAAPSLSNGHAPEITHGPEDEVFLSPEALS